MKFIRLLLSSVLMLLTALSFSQSSESGKLLRIEKMQKEIAEAMNLKTVFRDTEAELVMFDFWEDSQEMVMVGSRYEPRFTWVNRATCNYLGYTKSELTQTYLFTDLIHPDDMERSVKAFSRFQSTGKIGFEGDYFKNRYRHKSGHYLPMYWSNVIINDKAMFLMQASKTQPQNTNK